MNATDTIIWQTEAHGRTLQSVADSFADTNWDRPRKATKIASDGTFKIRDGVATYRICKAVNDFVPVYCVVRL